MALLRIRSTVLNLCWFRATLSLAFDLTSLTRLRFALRFFNFHSSSWPETHRLGTSISSEITASVLNASIKKVSPVKLRLVVQYDHKRPSMSSA